MNKSQSSENRGIPIRRIACPPLRRNLTWPSFSLCNSSSILMELSGNSTQIGFLPTIHLLMAGKCDGRKLRIPTRWRRCNHDRIQRPQPTLGLVIIGHFHTEIIPDPLERIQSKSDLKPTPYTNQSVPPRMGGRTRPIASGENRSSRSRA